MRVPHVWSVVVVLLVLASATAQPAHATTTAQGPRSLTPLASSAALGPATPGSPSVWNNLSAARSVGHPDGTVDASVAYDAASGGWYAFGGCSPTCPVSNSTWEFVQGGWVNLSIPGPTPPARDAASMVYDPNAGGLVLFGGGNGVGGYLNDTWLLHDGRWSNLSALGVAPSPRGHAAMVYDPAPNVNGTVLFGGCYSVFLSIVCYNDTWLWQRGAGWTQLDPAISPPSRGFSGAAYDPSGGDLLLFGGLGICGSGLCDFSDSWEFHSGTWWPVLTGATTPPGRYWDSLAYDAPLGGVLLADGVNLTSGLDDNTSWIFSSGGWTNSNVPGGLPLRSAAGVASDAAGTSVLFFGGWSDPAGTLQSDTWVLEPPLTLGLSASTAAPEIGQTVEWSGTIAGGSPPFSLQLVYGDGTGDTAPEAGRSFGFAHTFSVPGSWTARAIVVDAVGLNATSSLLETVSSGPSVTVRALSPGGDVGLPVAFAANFTGALPSAPLAWQFGDGGSATGASASHTFSSPGAFTISVEGTDSKGASANASLPLVVHNLPSVSIDTGSAVAGRPTALVANVSEGTAPYTYSWALGDGAASNAPGPTHTFAAAGTYTVNVWANDSAGGSAHAQVTIAVVAAPGETGAATGTAPIPTWYWVALGAIVLGTVIGAVVLLRRKR